MPAQPKQPLSRRTSAARMRALRARRGEGIQHVVPLEIYAKELDHLVASGWLRDAERGDKKAVAVAIGNMLMELLPQVWAAKQVSA
jgi:hypothetical protein